MTVPYTKLDANQTISRDVLQQIFPYLNNKQLDLLLRSINLDLTSPLKMDASSTPNRTVSIGPAIVNNTESGRQKSISHIGAVVPVFTSGSIIFPSSNGGTITVSPGSNATLNLPSNNYSKILVALDASGNLMISQGTPNVVEASAQIPAPITGALSIGYISLFNNAGTVQNIVQNKIFQFGSGGSDNSGSSLIVAHTADLNIGANEQIITFPEPFSDVNYALTSNFVNEVDADPAIQNAIIKEKNTHGFHAKWNADIESVNYKLDYIAKGRNSPVASSFIVASGGTVTIDGNFKVHTFTADDEFKIFYAPLGATVEYLVVAGGGGSTPFSGGGGGGLLTGNVVAPVAIYPISVGDGGGIFAGTPPYKAGDGENSSAFGFTAIGGGGAGGYNGVTPAAAGNGGSGGGSIGTLLHGTGTVGQGNDGGDGGIISSQTLFGGGGGGAGFPGTDGVNGTGGNGGDGIQSSITGTPTYYAGGGPGMSYILNVPQTRGTSGQGGAGNGTNCDGTPNTGGGAGATGNVGSGTGIGGSGVIIVRYQFQ